MHRLIVGVTAAVVLAACTNDTPPPEPEGPDRLTVATSEVYGSLDPAACYDTFCAYTVLANTHEGLVGLGANLEPEPVLAESWEVSEDGTEHTFLLRQGVELHDGTALTADVVRFSLERVRSIGLREGPGFLLFDLDNDPPREGVIEIDTPDEHTVVLRLAVPDPAFGSKLAFPVGSVVSPNVYPADSLADDDTVVGSGPYRLDVEASTANTLELVAHEEYWGAAPQEPAVRIEMGLAADDLFDGLQEGEFHLALHAWSPEEVNRLEDLEGVELAGGPGLAVRFLAFNTERPPFDAVEVRRAVAAVVDRAAIIDGPLRTTATPLDSLVPPELATSVEAFQEEADPAAAAAHLEEAGIDADAPVAFELWYTPSHYGEAEAAIAEMIAEALEDTGRFEVVLREADWASYRVSFARGDLDAYLLGWFPDFFDARDYLAPFLFSPGARAVGSHYTSERVDELLTEERTTVDGARRIEIFHELQEILAADVPYVPLWQPLRYAGVRDARGVQLDATQRLRLGSIERTTITARQAD